MKTAELIDKDGWSQTGDIGRWLDNGTLKIIDRKKHIFKLSQVCTYSNHACCKFVACQYSFSPFSILPVYSTLQGEYLAPEKIENVYITSRYVAQAYLYGDSLKSYAVAIIVPDEDAVSVWAKENNVSGNFIELCTYDVRMMSSSRIYRLHNMV